MNKEIAELLRERAMVGRMTVKDKQLMLEAADQIENGEPDVIKEIFKQLEKAIKVNAGQTPTEAYFGIINAIAEIKDKFQTEN